MSRVAWSSSHDWAGSLIWFSHVTSQISTCASATSREFEASHSLRQQLDSRQPLLDQHPTQQWLFWAQDTMHSLLRAGEVIGWLDFQHSLPPMIGGTENLVGGTTCFPSSPTTYGPELSACKAYALLLCQSPSLRILKTFLLLKEM